MPRSERLVCLRFNNALGLRHLLATGGSEGTVRVLDVDAKKEVRRIRKFKGGGITSVHFPASAPHLLIVANQNGELFTLSLQASAPKRTYISIVPNGTQVTCLACPAER